MDLINYLRDAQLVADFQRYFGIQLAESNGQINNNEYAYESNDLSQQISNNLTKRPTTNGLTARATERPLDGQINGGLKNDSKSQPDSKANRKNYVINNLGFYYLFCFGASLGYEIFYALFFPFFLHNVDSYVGRRLIVIWSIVMYCGQALKDIIKWNRPQSPPVVVLEPEYSMEYGMPSTHAMVGFALPFSVFIFTQSRYIYPFWLGFALASIWCLLVCGSRLYLGMHTVLDILVGLLLSATILSVCVPFVDLIDEPHFKSLSSPLITSTILCLMSIYYPKSDRWSPARGDTCVMVGFGYGIMVGTWFNYQLGIMTDPTSPLPFEIYWPTKWVVFLVIVRTGLVAITIELTRMFGKKVIYRSLCNLQKLNFNDSESMKQPGVEVPLKLITYGLIGINVATILPISFGYLNLDL